MAEGLQRTSGESLLLLKCCWTSSLHFRSQRLETKTHPHRRRMLHHLVTRVRRRDGDHATHAKNCERDCAQIVQSMYKYLRAALERGYLESGLVIMNI